MSDEKPLEERLSRLSKLKQTNKIAEKTGILVAPPNQPNLFHVEKQVEHDGVEMGVLENGIPYLSESGLARMCGISRKNLYSLSQNWSEEQTKPRGAEIKKLLEQSGYHEDTLFLKSEHNGGEVNSYTEPVCLAMLEYYAFMTDEPRPEAVRAFRALARTSFRKFVYKAVGYSPEQKQIDSWRHFHDRLDLTTDSTPFGYFSVFQEIASMIVPMIRAGVLISDKVVPDISVGKVWSDYWKKNQEDFEELFGKRIKYNHNYPDYYPQAKSNPQPSYAYPDDALGLFRYWLRNQYIINRFPAYILNQAKQGKISGLVVSQISEAFETRLLTTGKE